MVDSFKNTIVNHAFHTKFGYGSDYYLDHLDADKSIPGISSIYLVQGLYTVNIYLLLFSIIGLSIFFNKSTKINLSKNLDRSIFFKKNLILCIFTLSFILTIFMVVFTFKMSGMDITLVHNFNDSNDDDSLYTGIEFTSFDELADEYIQLWTEIYSSIESIENFYIYEFNKNLSENEFWGCCDYGYQEDYTPTDLDIYDAAHESLVNSLSNFVNNGINYIDIVLLLLCYIIGFFSFLVLGDRVWLNNANAIILLLYFPLIILLLIQAESLVEIFLYYELLMLPSVFLVNKLGYSNKSHTANLYFFVWTQIGSIIVLFAILYLNITYSITSFNYLKQVDLSETEQFYLFLLFFIGFGVKVPIWPFHFWLTKVHVEAPSGFSMFLSGFLVKTAIVCFYKILITLNITTSPMIPITICAIGILDASLKFWGQVDIKKLIAYATIQEMNCIYILFLGDDSWAIKGGLIFLVAHGLLSALMFYIIELIYKRTLSRSTYKVYGLAELYPNLTIIIWVMLVIFLGFPGTAKFFAEFFLITMFAEFSIVFSLFMGFFIIFIGGIGFAKCWFSVLYGHGGYNHVSMDLSKEELYISLALASISIASPILFYFF